MAEMEEKVTRSALRDMPIGSTRVFKLPNAAACDAGKVTASQMGNYLGCKFTSKTDYGTSELTITKIAL